MGSLQHADKIHRPTIELVNQAVSAKCNQNKFFPAVWIVSSLCDGQLEPTFAVADGPKIATATSNFVLRLSRSSYFNKSFLGECCRGRFKGVGEGGCATQSHSRRDDTMCDIFRRGRPCAIYPINGGSSRPAAMAALHPERSSVRRLFVRDAAR